MQNKNCSSCKIEKSLDEFYSKKRGKLGVSAECKSCFRARMTKTKDKQNLSKEEQNLLSKKRHLRKHYDLSLEDFEELSKKQNYQCAICGMPENSCRPFGLNVDHDHRSGKIRGLLCRSCNLGLGLFRDNELILKNALNYIFGIENEKFLFPLRKVKNEN